MRAKGTTVNSPPILSSTGIDGERRMYVSPTLPHAGIVHGFATRCGGVSKGELSLLDFGKKSSADKREENLHRLKSLLGFEGQVYFLRQVHGDQVVVLDFVDTPEAVAKKQADALVTNEPRKAVGVLTADCVPVLFADPIQRVVAAAHAGWRGIVRGVLQSTVGTMVERFACNPGNIRAAIGPSIGVCCYEVGEEVAREFQHLSGVVRSKISSQGKALFLDLPKAAAQILGGLGIPQEQIGLANLCTCCREDLFFSYRRDADEAGRHLNLIALKE
ncbi:MAG: peptidoglycan editing factor PgeF [Pseudomonadota bacterium]